MAPRRLPPVRGGGVWLRRSVTSDASSDATSADAEFTLAALLLTLVTVVGGRQAMSPVPSPESSSPKAMAPLAERSILVVVVAPLVRHQLLRLVMHPCWLRNSLLWWSGVMAVPQETSPPFPSTTIRTKSRHSGSGSHGIFLQSIGGGGGRDPSSRCSTTVPTLTSALGSAAVGGLVGGAEDSSPSAPPPKSLTRYRHRWCTAHGVFLQSIVVVAVQVVPSPVVLQVVISPPTSPLAPW